MSAAVGTPRDRPSRREGAAQQGGAGTALELTTGTGSRAGRDGAASSFSALAERDAVGIQPRRPIRVVEVANLVTQAVQHFRALAIVCLDNTSTPQRDAIGTGVGLVAWEDVPRACGFKISRPGGRGHQRLASVEEKLEQQREYTAHQLWA